MDRRYGLALLLPIVLLGCSATHVPASGETWPEADALFRNDARWLGGDGACTVDLGGGRTLWLFGDSLIATSLARSRSQSTMVHNSAAIQTGSDPSHALMEFFWRTKDDGSPGSFLPEADGVEFWPEHGVRFPNGPLLLFYQRVVVTGTGLFDFHPTGWLALRIDHPDESPRQWVPLPAELPSESNGVIVGWGALVDREHLYVYGTRGLTHDAYLARWNLDEAAAGDLSRPEWWTDSGWVPESQMPRDPAVVINDGSAEFSVHFEERLGAFVEVASEGFGATTLALRTAPRPEGPWTGPMTFFRPPESYRADDPFVYAGKAHPELRGADLVATYVPSKFGPTDDDPSLYVPHFVRITYR